MEVTKQVIKVKRSDINYVALQWKLHGMEHEYGGGARPTLYSQVLLPQGYPDPTTPAGRCLYHLALKALGVTFESVHLAQVAYEVVEDERGTTGTREAQ